MSKYDFSISDIGSPKSSWIYISYNDYFDDIDGLIELIISIRDETKSKVKRIDPNDDIFTISHDPFKLKFQWDDLFGPVVILNRRSDRSAVIEMLNRHFEKLNSLD